MNVTISNSFNGYYNDDDDDDEAATRYGCKKYAAANVKKAVAAMHYISHTKKTIFACVTPNE